MVDQLYCLISSDHASSLVWAGDVDRTGRLFTFGVTEINEQEENVVSRPGINVRRCLFVLVGAKTRLG